MASSGNFCTLSPLDRSEYGTAPSLTGGNLRYQTTGSGPGNNDATRGTMATPTTGKWYFEFVDVQNYTVVGMQEIQPSGVRKWNTNGYPVTQSGISQFYVFLHQGDVNINNSNTSSAFTTFSDGDIGGIAIDLDNGAFYLHNAGTYVNSGDPTSGSSKTGSLGNITTGTEYIPITCNHSYGSDTRMYFNFGQDSTFQGYTTAGGNADANGFGDFKYAPPSGYLALCSANLPVSDDIDPAQTDDNIPSKNFNTVLYTGNDGAQSVTGVGFKPDLVWVKARNSAQHHALFDSSRGVLKRLGSSRTNAEDTDSSFLSSFDTDGFSWSSGGDNTQNGAYTYVGWCWRGNGGTTASNSDGSITSTVQANTKAGFSIVTYSGTLSGAGTASVGHGLTKKPDFLITKARTTNNDNGNWHCSHVGLTNFNYRIRLNTSEAQADRSSSGDMASLFTNSTFGTNYTSGLNVSGDNYVAYVWHSVEGYSKFGSFEGNANADGTFVYTGFRPRLLFIKNIDSSSPWGVYDGERPGFNDCDLGAWDENTALNNNIGTYPCDILSNGFKLRTSNATVNSSHTWVYGAWGDVPFKYNNTF